MSPRPWFDHTTDVKPLLDRFRDPKGWFLGSLPWPLRRLVIAWQFKAWPPNEARYIGLRRPPWEAFDLGRKLHDDCYGLLASDSESPGSHD